MISKLVRWIHVMQKRVHVCTLPPDIIAHHALASTAFQNAMGKSVEMIHVVEVVEHVLGQESTVLMVVVKW